MALGSVWVAQTHYNAFLMKTTQHRFPARCKVHVLPAEIHIMSIIYWTLVLLQRPLTFLLRLLLTCVSSRPGPGEGEGALLLVVSPKANALALG